MCVCVYVCMCVCVYMCMCLHFPLTLSVLVGRLSRMKKPFIFRHQRMQRCMAVLAKVREHIRQLLVLLSGWVGATARRLDLCTPL